MNELTEVFGDPFFWVGVGLFVFSMMGIIWILKIFQKQPEETSMLTTESMPASASTVKEKTKPRPRNPATLDELSVRLEKIETILAELAPKLQQPQEKNELADEMRTIAQTLKLQSGTGDPKEMRDLSAKLDKIYQVLVSLSSPNSK